MSRHLKNIISIFKYNKKELINIKKQICIYKDKEYIAIYNPYCIGIMNSTKELFENTLGLSELFNDKYINEIANCIVENNIKQIIFSPIAFGWKELIEKLKEKNSNIKIKFFWHGSHSLFVNRDESYFLYNILEMCDRKIVNSIAFAKESMADFYKRKGYNSFFIKNTVKNINLNDVENTEYYKTLKKLKDKSKVNIGLYSAGDRWEKNTFNQISSLSLLKNVALDCIPSTDLVSSFCKLMNINLKESSGYLKREEMAARMALNDMNLYVTFTECSPIVPLESLEMGIPCITGNNHHYFKDTSLEEYLIVKSEDDIDEIAEKTKIALNNKVEILKIYKEWKKRYDEESKISVIEFLNS
jgi:glycosyltransferase involved in cell wall biosynthesis